MGRKLVKALHPAAQDWMPLTMPPAAKVRNGLIAVLQICMFTLSCLHGQLLDTQKVASAMQPHPSGCRPASRQCQHGPPWTLLCCRRWRWSVCLPPRISSACR